jgi:hypothetical protein
MSERAHVRSICVDSMLGIGRGHGFELKDLGPMVNIIHGPNGSGKTTVGRAMLLALFGGSKDVWKRLLDGSGADGDVELRRAQLAATITLVTSGDTDRTWEWELAGGEVTSQIDGEQSALSFGSADLAQRYRLGLVELLAESNEEFVREMMRQAAGGIDLEAIAGELQWDRQVPRPKLNEVRSAETKEKEVREAQTKLATHAAATLVPLQGRQEDLQSLVDEIAWIEKALNYKRACAEVTDLKGKLAEVPAIVQRLSGDEASKAHSLDDRVAEAYERLTDERKKLDRQEATQPQLNEDEQACEEVPLEPVHALSESLRKAETELSRAKESLFAASAIHQDAAKALAATSVPEDRVSDRVDAQVVVDAQKIVELAHDLQSLTTVQQLVQPLIAQLRPPGRSERVPDRNSLVRAAEILVAWLHAPAMPIVEPPRLPSWAWPAILVACAISLLLAALIHPVALVGLLAAGVAVLLIARRTTRDASEVAAPLTTDAATNCRQQFEDVAHEAGLKTPPSWSTKDVQRYHRTLLTLLARREVHDASSLLVDRAERLSADIPDAQQRLKTQCQSFEHTHHISIAAAGKPMESGWILWIVHRISGYRTAADGLVSATKFLEHVEGRVTTSRESLIQALRQVGLRARLGSAVITGESAARHLKALESRRQSDAGRSREIGLLQQSVEAAKDWLQERTDERSTFWTQLGLKSEDYPTLERLLEMREAAGELRRRLADEQRSIERLRNHLQGRDQLLLRDQEQLESDIARGQSSREDLNKCIDSVSELKAAIKHATDRLDLTKAQASVREAQEKLHAREQAWMVSVIRKQVLAWARDSLQQGVTPVMNRAQQFLTRFTQGRLTFKVISPLSADMPELQARGGAAEPWRPVQRLSSGERIQLLMAIRLAFLQENEERVNPLFLDEVLGSSDDDRADCIIDLVIGIARSGRQVFYATAQSDEVWKWKMRLNHAGIPYTVIDMADVRRMGASARLPLPPALPARPMVPPPIGRNHREYGEALKVPGVDWFEPDLGSLHVWHVIDDSTLLHEVLCSGVESLGQLDRMGPDAGDTPVGRAFRSSRAAACAYRVAGEAWRRGRGKPLTLEALQVADGVSDTFRLQIWQLVKDAHCDGQLFMQRLRGDPPPRWRDDSTGRLDAWMHAEGYLSDDDRMEPYNITVLARLETQNCGLDMTHIDAIEQRLREMLRWPNAVG